jgi:hypothetical protein
VDGTGRDHSGARFLFEHGVEADESSGAQRARIVALE